MILEHSCRLPPEPDYNGVECSNDSMTSNCGALMYVDCSTGDLLSNEWGECCCRTTKLSSGNLLKTVINASSYVLGLTASDVKCSLIGLSV